MIHLHKNKNLFLNFLIGFLSHIIPKNKKQILIGCNGGSMFNGNPKYFFLYLTKNIHSFKFFWITTNKNIIKELSQKNFPVLYLYSFSGFMALLRSNFLIFSHGIKDVSYSNYLPGNFKKIQTWHGTPLKKIGYDSKRFDVASSQKSVSEKNNFKDIKTYHTILSTSEPVKKILSKALNNQNVEILGYPRNDVFFNKNLVYENFEQKFNLNDYKKILLFCPTFRDNSSSSTPFSEKFLETINNYLRNDNWLLLLKSHINERLDFKKKFSNIKDVSDSVEDVQELLVYSDILITDYSGVFFDYILLDKPIIFYCYDFNEYLDSWEMYWDYFKDLPGPFAKNEEELIQILKTIDDVFQQEEYQKKYSSFKNKFNYFTKGDSCKRLLDYLNKT